jgi:hypothetical protein
MPRKSSKVLVGQYNHAQGRITPHSVPHVAWHPWRELSPATVCAGIMKGFYSSLRFCHIRGRCGIHHHVVRGRRKSGLFLEVQE